MQATGRHDGPPGVILAGGEGRRIGGGKPFVQLAGWPLVAHVAAGLAPQCGALAVNANGPAAGHDARGLPVSADAEQGLGPLGGVLARGVRRVTDFTKAQGAVTVMFPGTAPPASFNGNSRADLAVAKTREAAERT